MITTYNLMIEEKFNQKTQNIDLVEKKKEVNNIKIQRTIFVFAEFFECFKWLISWIRRCRRKEEILRNMQLFMDSKMFH